MPRTGAAVIASASVWSGAFLATGQALVWAAPESFARDGSTESGVLLSILVVSSALFAVAAGGLAARIAGQRALPASVGVVAVLFGLSPFVQFEAWEHLPTWYRGAFLSLLFPACAAGYWLGRPPAPGPEPLRIPPPAARPALRDGPAPASTQIGGARGGW
jgi:hypothetical protein